MSERDFSLPELQQGRQRFLDLVAAIRPELHRYCARMTGSVAEGEDIVQETLARAYYALSEFEQLPPLRPWLFTIAHRRALDHLRRYDRRMGEPLDAVLDTVADGAPDPGDALAHAETVRAALSRFVELPPAQRSCVILKDVLGHSLEEIATLLEFSVPAVKAALHRGRTRLQQQRGNALELKAPRQASPALARYATLFNARDWDGVRAMLAEDVQLDLVSRARLSGRREVGRYTGNYDRFDDWHLVPAWLDDGEVLAVFRNRQDARPGYFIELTLRDAQVTAIRDFRYVPYVALEAAIEFAANRA
ncbi:MAG: polymerase sigma-54 factor RpoN [Nevskia sp.]|nr:polymerase sigma-54 factor RpoN [Nevskia sp.]